MPFQFSELKIAKFCDVCCAFEMHFYNCLSICLASAATKWYATFRKWNSVGEMQRINTGTIVNHSKFQDPDSVTSRNAGDRRPVQDLSSSEKISCFSRKQSVFALYRYEWLYRCIISKLKVDVLAMALMRARISIQCIYSVYMYVYMYIEYSS